jgi:hypothetical protein
MLSVIILNVAYKPFMPSVVVLNAVMQSVVAPKQQQLKYIKNAYN